MALFRVRAGAGMALVFAGSAGLLEAAWQPPIGIPMPSFGVNEVAGAATVIVQGGAIPHPVPAGAVVEIRGAYTRSHTGGGGRIQCAGSAQKPAFIRGGAGAVVTGGWEISGSYCVIEGLKFGPGGSWTVLAPADHIAVRDNEFTGTLDGEGGIWVQTWTGGNASDIVLLRNKVHHGGDWQATYDQDSHGTGLYRSSSLVGTSATISNVWILDSEYSYNSGDGVQINANGYTEIGKIHHVYVGRNVAHHNKQSGFWSKEATDVVFSQNEAYEHRPSDSSSGQCMGYQYGPEWVWFLFNRVHDCDYGIQVVSDDNGTGQNVYVIGNVLYRIHGAGSASDPYSPAAIHFRGGTNRYVVNNTIYDADAGIESPVSDGFLYMVNNLITAPAKSGGRQVFLESPVLAAASTLHHSLFAGGARIDWGGRVYSSVAAFNASSGKTCTGCLESQPQFVNVAADDFHLKLGSPGIDGGSAESAVYNTFQARYGISILKDAGGAARPYGPAIDIGAYETASGAAPPFGAFDTPANGAGGITGAIPVTGWALDDVEVTTVQIYRNPVTGEPTQPNGKVYIGDATFVPGARPDVESAYPGYPFANRAGWGYMLLTNFFPPNSGNGTYTLYAYAIDGLNQSTLLGSKTITLDNAHATKPFGTLDTPGQGQTVSGTITVFGWALTPPPAAIPTDGSTITVYVDGAPLGHPTYNQYRSDIATLFPGYANSNGAVGYFVTDTATLTNGIHTIQWVVTDNQGRADGIGSRYFWVSN
jgi:hypothetical protein